MINQIDEAEFFKLAILYSEYNKCLSTNHNQSTSTGILLNELSQPGALAIGLYRKNNLVGFTLGKAYSDKLYTFTAMYIEPKFRYHTKKLFEESENIIKSLGYTGYISESHTKEGINMHNRMGCNLIDIKFYKEL